MGETSSRVPVHEAALLQWLRWRQLRNTLRLNLRQGPLRLLTILFCCLLIWGTIFALAYLGFYELRDKWHLHLDGQLIVVLFSLTFVALAMLLVFSTGIILYSSLFTARESTFLLTTPLAADQIFAFKYQGALAFSSWAFVLLASPLFLAYGLIGLEDGAAWYYYVLVPLFFFGFVLLPGSVGALFCLLFVNFFPRRRKQVLVLLSIILLAGVGWWLVARFWPVASNLLYGTNAIAELLGEFSLLQGWFPPARWTAEGFRAAAVGEPVTALYYLALVWSNGLMLYLGTAWLARKLYRRGHNLLATGVGQRRVYRASVLDRVFSGLVGYLDPQTRTLIEKDFRTFRRDPAQWAQILIFLGLMVLIFLNIRSYYFQQMPRSFQNGISLLNLTATGFLMCAYAGRFTYPMLSLEGRKFWILGLLPLERDKLLRGKFYFSIICTLVMGEFLCNLSDLVLGVPWPTLLLHSVIVAVLALGMSGLSTGLGATMPNFRETDPSKIAVGFGGTVMLITGLVFELAVVGLMALPWHLVLAVSESDGSSVVLRPWLWLALAAGLGLGIGAVVVPMRAGTRALRRMEF
jgi:ABC-2 type transport system permease protein